MANETKVQAFVHALEEGGWVSRINLILVLAVVTSVYVIVILNQFKGLSDAKGMDQAQVGRQLASGQGFTTLFLRPIAYGQLVRKLGTFPPGPVPDTYNAPLNPFVDSLLLRLTKKTWEMSPHEIVYPSDRLIAGASLLFFLISVAVNFSSAKRLFDRRLAVLGMWLVLLCDVFWNFSLSGLPQMLMLLIFSLVNYCLVRAIENRDEGKTPLMWLGLSGVGFGLLVLAHGLAAWIFAGALVYMAFAFLPPGDILWLRVLRHPAWIPLVIVLGMEGPWLLRLYDLTGNPFGVALYSGFGQLLGSESQVMRSLSLDTTSITFSWFRSKVQGQMLSQFASVYSYLGHSPIAPVFFVSLLHFFKRPLTASFRWCVFWMWFSALFGMSLFGLTEDSAIHANDLHVLFIPMAMFYGLAFVLVLWTRLANDRPEVGLKYVRWSFFGLVYVISGFPLLYMLITGGRLPILWPPYYPGNVSILGTWTEPNEIIVSDMPWAVAWYANRESVWLPDTIANFMDFHDYNRLNGPIVGLYLTPITGDSRFFTDIEKGEYKDWAPFILRNVNTSTFPLQAVTAMSIGNECIYFSDRDRWTNKAE
jgi:4-amino-4-deoxy-L-arabinose transferase-like glycosyltransferase